MISAAMKARLPTPMLLISRESKTSSRQIFMVISGELLAWGFAAR